MNHNLNHQQIAAQSVLGDGIIVVVKILRFMENSFDMMHNSIRKKSNPNMFSRANWDFLSERNFPILTKLPSRGE